MASPANVSRPSLHIVSFDVPYPPDYGGAIDVYHKLRALHRAGVAIKFHCYYYGRPPRPELTAFCQSVQYYPRRTGPAAQFSYLPYIVQSRDSEALLSNLLADDDPILFEGVHTVWPLLVHNFGDRRVVLRAHNVEHEYYGGLARGESSLWRRYYYQKEASWLQKLEGKRLPDTLPVAAISQKDVAYFDERYLETRWIPPFHGHEAVSVPPGIGNYFLYHGRLDVTDNLWAADLLLTQFANRDLRLIVAGKNPGDRLIRDAARSGVEIIADPTGSRMTELIAGAQGLLLPAAQPTGVKLKLLDSLYRGRHCIANHTMLAGTGLEEVCELVERDFYAAARRIAGRAIIPEQRRVRKELLNTYYDPGRNVQKLLQFLGFEQFGQEGLEVVK